MTEKKKKTNVTRRDVTRRDVSKRKKPNKWIQVGTYYSHAWDLLYSPFQSPSALHAQSQRDERTRKSKCTQRWLANERFCQWIRPAPCAQSTSSVRAVVPKDYERYYTASTNATLPGWDLISRWNFTNDVQHNYTITLLDIIDFSGSYSSLYIKNILKSTNC